MKHAHRLKLVIFWIYIGGVFPGPTFLRKYHGVSRQLLEKMNQPNQIILHTMPIPDPDLRKPLGIRSSAGVMFLAVSASPSFHNFKIVSTTETISKLSHRLRVAVK